MKINSHHHMLKSNYWFQTITLLQSKDQVTFYVIQFLLLTPSWQRLLSYRNQSIDLHSKSMDVFLYDNGLCHEKVNEWSDMWFTRHSQDFYHLSPQNVISLKEFETTREIGLIIYCRGSIRHGDIKFLEVRTQVDIVCYCNFI